MTTSQIKRRRTVQQTLLRRACQTQGFDKSQDAVEYSDRNQNGETDSKVVLSSGPTQERPSSRTVGTLRRVPAAGTPAQPASGERKTAGKITGCENLRKALSSSRKPKPNDYNRNVSGQRSGSTSRGSTRSRNSSCAYPSKWLVNVSREEAMDPNSKGSLDEITNCSLLNQTPYDHNLNTPLKLVNSCQCPMKNKTRQRIYKSANVSGAQTPAPTQSSSRNHSSGGRTNPRIGSSQSSGVRLKCRVYSGEEDRQNVCPSKSNSEISNSSKCKLNCPGVTFKNYGGYSPSETECDTTVENNQCQCSNSYLTKIDKVSKPPNMYENPEVWSLEMSSATQIQEQKWVDEDGHSVIVTLSDYNSTDERKSSTDRCTCKCCSKKPRRDRDSHCKCSSKTTRRKCPSKDEKVYRCSRRTRDASTSWSRNSSPLASSDCSENDYKSSCKMHHVKITNLCCERKSPKEKSCPKRKTCSDYGYIPTECKTDTTKNKRQDTEHGIGGTSRDSTNCPHRSRPPGHSYTMEFGRGCYRTGNCEREACEMEYECKPSEAISSRKCTEAVTQTSEIIMTEICSPNHVQGSLEKNRCSQLSSIRKQAMNTSVHHCTKGTSCERELNVQYLHLEKNGSVSLKQEQFKSEQKSKPNQQTNSLIFESNQKEIHLGRGNSLNSACPPCMQELPPSCHSCQQGLSNLYQQHDYHKQYENLSDQDIKNSSSSTESSHKEAKYCKCTTRNQCKKSRKSSSKSRSRNRSSSARRNRTVEEEDCSNDTLYYTKGTKSYECCNCKILDQKEDQCDVIKILSILQKTVAGLENEIRKGKGKGYESCRSSGNGSQPKRLKTPVDSWEKYGQTINIAHKSRSTPLCQQELSPSCPPCQDEAATSTPTCKQELCPSPPPCKQDQSLTCPPCQEELSPSTPPCQEEVSSSCQKESASNQPFQQELPPAGPPCQQGLFQQHIHRPGFPSPNQFSQAYNEAVPVTFEGPINPYPTNSPYKNEMNPADVYLERKDLPLFYNWNPPNQENLNISHRNTPDLGTASGSPRTEPNYPSAIRERKAPLYPSINDPERILLNADWFGNNHQSVVGPGNPLTRSKLTERRYGKCSMIQIRNQNPSNRGRVTFQEHDHEFSRCSRAASNESIDSIQYCCCCCGERETGLAKRRHKSPCKCQQYSQEVYYKDPEIRSCSSSRTKRNRKEIDFEVCELPGRLKRAPKITILCNNPNCPGKLKRALAVPCEISDSQCSIVVGSSIELCENPYCTENRRKLWQCGGLENYTEYEKEENSFEEAATDTSHEDLPSRQRVIFTDVTNKKTRSDSGQTDRFDDDSTKSRKHISKKRYHRYVPVDKMPINIVPEVQPLSCTRNRHNPYLIANPLLNSYDKHILNNFQKDKIEKSKDREFVKVDCRRKTQTPPRDYHYSYSKKAAKENVRKRPSSRQPPSYECDECKSITKSSACSCSKKSPKERTKPNQMMIRPPRETNCLDNPRSSPSTTSECEYLCCKQRQIPRCQRVQPVDCCCNASHILEKERRRNCEPTTSKSSGLTLVKRKEKLPPPKKEEKSKKERGKNVERNTSKSSGFFCFKKKEKLPPPKNAEKLKKETGKNVDQTTSKSSVFFCFKKKEQPPPPKSSEGSSKKDKKDSQSPRTNSKSSVLLCFKKKEKNPSQSENYDKKERRRNVKKEKDSQSEETKSKSSGLLCFKKKEKPPPEQSENYGKKERHKNFKNEKDSQSQKPKSKSSGLFCFKNKEKHPAPKSDAKDSQKERHRNFENENESQCEETKSKSSGLVCFKKKKKPEQICCKEEIGKYVEKETEPSKECEKRPSWSTEFLVCRRNSRKKDKNVIQQCEDTSEKPEKTKKPSLPKYFSCFRGPKTQKEGNRTEECSCCEDQPNHPCGQEQHANEEVKVLYDSSYRFNQESCSCVEIKQITYCYNSPQEVGAQEKSASSRLGNKDRQNECANGFYKIVQ